MTDDLPVLEHQAPPAYSTLGPARTMLRVGGKISDPGMAITPTTSHCIEAWELDLLRQWRPAFLHLTLQTDALADDVDWAGVRRLLQASGADLRLDLCMREGLGEGRAQDKALRQLARALTRAGVSPASVVAPPRGSGATRLLQQLFPAAAMNAGTTHLHARPDRPEDREERGNMDARMRGLSDAARLLGHLAAADQAAGHALTLPPLLGEDGLWQFRAGTWQATPAAALLDVCLRWTDRRRAELHGPEGMPLSWPLVGMTGSVPQGRQLLLANLDAKPQKLLWPGHGHWTCLDAASWRQDQDEPARHPWRDVGHGPCELVVGPYALARLDLSDRD